MDEGGETQAAAFSRRGFLATAAVGAAALGAPSGAMGAPAAPTRGPRIMPAQRSWTPVPAQAPAKDGVAELPGTRLYYWDTGGTGEPIVLMHPATGSAAIWGYQQPVFVRAGYRVIAYSRRGHYRSDPAVEGALGTSADDLANLVDFLKLDRFHLLGSAAGGFIVPDYALSFPERLLSVVIACSQGGLTEPSYRERIAAITPAPFPQMPASFRELGPSYRAANPEGVKVWEELEHMALSSPNRLRQPAKNTILWPELAKIRTPALVFTGAADLYMPVPLMLDYASRLPNAETAILSESGHSGYWEQPEAFNALVLDFIRRHPARRLA